MQTLAKHDVLIITKENLRSAFLEWYIETLTQPPLPKPVPGEHTSMVEQSASYVWDILHRGDKSE